MTEPPDRTPEGAEPDQSRGIGVDQWVAESDDRRQRQPGLRGRIEHLWGILPPAGKLALLTPAIIVPFLPISNGNLYNYGVFILIYALLALGLNVVVGWAGLLDLGYVAFFGFGAYIYAFLSGTHSAGGHTYTFHWGAEKTIPIAVAVCALLGLFLGSSSRRLLGDYLAIVTLFFGQAFVVFTNAANPAGITNGSNGLANVDPLTFFGDRIVIDTTRGYYWFLLGTVGLLLVALYALSESRTGRAWKASREDPLAAELMGMPVNRLKIMAFSFGAGIAGLAGSVFAAVQTGAFPQNFGTTVLIIIYAVVILGGNGKSHRDDRRRRRDHRFQPGPRFDVTSEPAAHSVLRRHHRRRLLHAEVLAAEARRVRRDGGLRSPGARDRWFHLVRRNGRRGYVGRLPRRCHQELGLDPC